jgi:hypothetical protein
VTGKTLSIFGQWDAEPLLLFWTDPWFTPS